MAALSSKVQHPCTQHNNIEQFALIFSSYHFFLCSSIETPPGPRRTIISSPPITESVCKISYFFLSFLCIVCLIYALDSYIHYINNQWWDNSQYQFLAKIPAPRTGRKILYIANSTMLCEKHVVAIDFECIMC